MNICGNCKKPFEPDRWHPDQQYCSRPCREKAYSEKIKAERLEARSEKPDMECAYKPCKNRFVPKPRQIYCSRKCAEMQRCDDYKAARPTYTGACAVEGCEKEWSSRQSGRKFCDLHSSLRGKEAQERVELTPDEVVKDKELASIEKKVRDDVGRTRILAELLDDAVKAVDPKDVPHYKKPAAVSKRDKETMVVLVSDLHPGLITPSYNLDVFHKRWALLVEKIILIHDIITQTIPIEKIVFIKLGDLVSGQGIFPGQAWKSQVHVLKQIYHEVSPELIGLNLTMLEYFKEVEDHYIPGNHGSTGKDFHREVNFDNIVAQDIWRRFEFVDRVNVDIEWDWYKMVDIYKWRFMCIHGNQIRSWLNIPFYGLVNKGMRWQGSIPEAPWHYMVHGHWHTAFEFPWNNFWIIGNGSLVSGDDFALRELGMASFPAQQVFGVHPKRGITWRYTLNLS